MGKMFKVEQIAVGPGEMEVRLLDSNGRLWAPNIVISGGGSDGWFNDDVAGAVALSIDGQHGQWVINPEGKIFYGEPPQGLGVKADRWIEESLQDDAGRFVKATQIAAGENTVMAVDDQRRLWQRWHAAPGRTGTPWMLDRSTPHVKLVAAGADDRPYCYLNDSGKLFTRLGDNNWQEWQVLEGSGEDLTNIRTPGNMGTNVRLEMGRLKHEQYFYSNLFYLRSDGKTNGYMYEPGGMEAIGGTHWQDPIGMGVDFAVREPNDIWMVNANGDIYRRTKKPFTSHLVVGKVIPVKVQGNDYFWTKIKGPDFSEARIYWIQPGNTFNRLAADLGTTPAALKAKNPQITNTDVIKAFEPLHLA